MLGSAERCVAGSRRGFLKHFAWPVARLYSTGIKREKICYCHESIGVRPLPGEDQDSLGITRLSSHDERNRDGEHEEEINHKNAARQKAPRQENRDNQQKDRCGRSAHGKPNRTPDQIVGLSEQT